MGVWYYPGRRARVFFGWMVSGLYRSVWQSASPQKRGISGSCLVRSTPTNVPFGGGQIAHRYRWRISLPGRQGRPSHGPVLLGKAKRGKQFLNSDFFAGLTALPFLQAGGAKVAKLQRLRVAIVDTTSSRSSCSLAKRRSINSDMSIVRLSCG